MKKITIITVFMLLSVFVFSQTNNVPFISVLTAIESCKILEKSDTVQITSFKPSTFKDDKGTTYSFKTVINDIKLVSSMNISITNERTMFIINAYNSYYYKFIENFNEFIESLNVRETSNITSESGIKGFCVITPYFIYFIYEYKVDGIIPTLQVNILTNKGQYENQVYQFQSSTD